MLLSNPFMVDPRVYKEAKALTEAGHEVTVIVWDRKNEYTKEEKIEGINLIRIHATGLIKFLPNDVCRNPVWWRRAYRIGLRLHRSGCFRFDIVHCHDLDTLQIGVWLKKKLEIVLIYDAHEIFGYMISRDMPKVVVNFSFFMEKHLVRHVDHIIIAEETYREYFLGIGITSSCLTTVLNCKDLITDKYQPPQTSVFTIVYIGVLNHSRFFPEALEVIGKIDNVHFTVAGKKENLYCEIKKLSKKFSNVSFLGAIPYNQVIPITLNADLVLCLVNPTDINNKIASANKQFEAMVCGRPIICTKGTRSGDITLQEKCGIVIEYDKKSLWNAIIQLRDSPFQCEEFGKNALNAAIHKYNWGIEKKKLLLIYSNLGGRHEE